jgi:heme-degrading monooxygenase HmoA
MLADGQARPPEPPVGRRAAGRRGVGPDGLKTMITVLRRWFVPTARLEEFRDKWRQDVMPDVIRQPGCIRVEMYESSIREHWVSAVSWENEQRRLEALAQLARHQAAFAEYERFEPEILILRSHAP